MSKDIIAFGCYSCEVQSCTTLPAERYSSREMLSGYTVRLVLAPPREFRLIYNQYEAIGSGDPQCQNTMVLAGIVHQEEPNSLVCEVLSGFEQHYFQVQQWGMDELTGRFRVGITPKGRADIRNGCITNHEGVTSEFAMKVLNGHQLTKER